MSFFHEIEFITRLNFRLKNFKRRGDVFNFSCPLCGDSKKNSRKARGYIFKSKNTNTFLYKCYNCNESTTFSNFLKKLDPQYYSEYINSTNSLFANFSKNDITVSKPQEPEKPDFDHCKSLITIDKFGTFFKKVENLPLSHYARTYLENRKIPTQKINTEFYFTEDFRKSIIDVLSAAGQSTEAYKSLRPNDPRVIIPFVDENGIVLGFQGRTLNPENKVRYITIKIDPDANKIYGLHGLDKSAEKIYVLEGPIDSMFVTNSVAVMDANLSKVEKLLPDIPKEKLILVFDNEPRSTNIVQSMNAAIQKGFSVVMLPEDKMENCKDINDLIKNKNFNTSGILDLLEKNTYTNDTTAHRFLTQLQFNKWKKVS